MRATYVDNLSFEADCYCSMSSWQNLTCPYHEETRYFLCCRLNGKLYRQELRDRGQEVKPLGRALHVTEGQIRWRVLMSGQRLLHVQRLALSLVPHVAQLNADAEAQQGFVSAMPEGEYLQTQLLNTNPLIAPDPQVCKFDLPGAV